VNNWGSLYNSLDKMSIKLDFISFFCEVIFVDNKIMWKAQNIPTKYTNDRHCQKTYINDPHCQFKMTKDQLINQYPQLNSSNRKFEDIESDKKTIYTVKVDNPFEVLFDEQLIIKLDNEYDINDYKIHNNNVTTVKSSFKTVNLYKSKKYKKINNNVIYDFEDPPLINKHREMYVGDDSPKLLIIKNKKSNIVNVYSNMYLTGTNIDEIIISYSKQKQNYLNCELCNMLGKNILRPFKMMSLWWIHNKIQNLCKSLLYEMKIFSGKILNINKLINDSQLF